MYTLDFETMIQVMQEHRRTGILSAYVASGVMSLRGPCSIEITLKAGNIFLCNLIGHNGGQLTGKKAEQAITQLGRLNWTFTPQTEAVPQPEYLPSPTIGIGEKKFFPRRTNLVRPEQVRTWPRIHRSVFALADGTKSVAKIAEILSTSPDLVEKALRELQLIGVINTGP